MTYDRIRGTIGLLPDVSLFEAQATLERASEEQGQYIILALATHEDMFPHLEHMFTEAANQVKDGPSFIRPLDKGIYSKDIPDSDEKVHVVFYQADRSVVDLLLETRPDDNLIGLLKVPSYPTMKIALEHLIDDTMEYLKSYPPDRIFIPDSVNEDLFYKEQDVEPIIEVPIASAEEEENVDRLLDGFYDKMGTATGMGNSLVDDISKIYAESQEKYQQLENGNMTDVTRMAMHRSLTLTARMKFSNLVLESPLQLTRFLALYDDHKSSPDSTGFYDGLEKGMGDLLDFEMALIDYGELSLKKRETGSKIAAALLEVWKGREMALISYEQSNPEEAVERMETLSGSVDRIMSFDSMFKRAEVVMDAHLKGLEAEGNESRGKKQGSFVDDSEGSDSSVGSIPPRDRV